MNVNLIGENLIQIKSGITVNVGMSAKIRKKVISTKKKKRKKKRINLGILLHVLMEMGNI